MNGRNLGDLTPVQYLIMETLAARWRLGERSWPFPNEIKRYAEALSADHGYVSVRSDVAPGTIRIISTVKGREAWNLPEEPGWAPRTIETLLADTAPDTQHVTVSGSKGRWVCSCGEVVASGLDHQRGMAS